jgi:DNA-directed RNA polymerase subunit beta'
MDEGVTIKRQTDEFTGLSSISVMDCCRATHAGKDIVPAVTLVDGKGKELMLAGTNVPAHYFLPHGAMVNLEDGAKVEVGDVIARIPQEGSKTRDITGGLPRVAIFSKRENPKSPRSSRKSRVPSALVKRPRASVVW